MSWPLVAISEVADVMSGYGFPREEQGIRDGEYPFFKVGDMNSPGNEKVLLTPNHTITEETLLKLRVRAFPPGTTVFPKIGAAIATNKKRMLVRPSVVDNNVMGLIPNDKFVDPWFLFYWLQQFDLQKAANIGPVPSIRKTEFEKIQIPLPPLSEQRRIVEILDQADALRKKRAEADAKAAHILPALFYEMFGDPKLNLKGMSSIRVGEAGKVQLGRQRAPKYQTGKFTHPYVRVANVFEDRIDVSDLLSMDFDEKDFIQYKLQYGDILLNEGQSTELVGRPAMWREEVPECCFQNTLIRFQPDRRRVLPDYALAYFLVCFRGGAFAQLSSKTSSVAHLGASRFAAMPFPLLCESLGTVGRRHRKRQSRSGPLRWRTSNVGRDSCAAVFPHRFPRR